MTDASPTFTPGNPFAVVAYALFKVRHSLEDIEEAGRPPRWVRIARAREPHGIAKLNTAVKQAVDGFAEALSYLAELTLKIREVLIDIDSAKALTELTADFVDAATSDEFVSGIHAFAGLNDPANASAPIDPNAPPPPSNNPLAGLNDVVKNVGNFLGYVPEPDDVIDLGHQLYRLLCIAQEPLPHDADETTAAAATERQLDVDKTGKIRLLQWALGHDLGRFGLPKIDSDSSGKLDLVRFGGRRLWRSAPLPQHSVVRWGPDESDEILVDLSYQDDSMDLVETHALLERLGYTAPAVTDAPQFSAELRTRLRRFQVANQLTAHGELDNHTINRLLNLDFGAKNLARAVPYQATADGFDADGAPPSLGGELKLVNGDADHPQDQAITPIKQGKYSYYRAGPTLPWSSEAQPPPAGAWICDLDSDAELGNQAPIVPQFVALQSRQRVAGAGRVEGGKLSEGEAASGTFFFAARHCEPWKAGRHGIPGDGTTGDPPALLNPNGDPPITTLNGSYSRMYQWVELPPQPTAGWKRYVRASALRRSLYENRSANGLPDQGRIRLEFYGGSSWSVTAPALFLTRRQDVLGSRIGSSYPPDGNWYPSHDVVTQALALDQIAIKRHWVKVENAEVEVPATAAVVLILVEGKHQADWDIDAYFDDIRIAWSLKKVSE